MICRFASIMTIALVCSAPALAEDLTIAVEHAQVVRLPGEASAIIIGNPSIADALVHDGRTLVLTGDNAERAGILTEQQSSRLATVEAAVSDPS